VNGTHTNGMEVDADQKEADLKALDDIVEPTRVPIESMYLVTAGYDGQVKMWSSDDWQLVKSISSEAGGKIMSCDLSSGESFPTNMGSV